MAGCCRVLLTVLLLVGSTLVTAADITARQAWIRLLPGSLPAAGYLQLVNRGTQTVRLTGVQGTAFAAIEIHESSEQSGVARMRRVESLAIPAGKTVALKPLGYHLMLFNPVEGLKPGGRVTLTLEFSDASRLPVAFQLRDAAGQ